jgi:hypothetical protein
MTTIKVKSPYDEELVTVQIRGEYGDLVECNHAGAEEQEMDFVAFSWWEDAHTMVPDDSVTQSVLVCDKCDAWEDPNEGGWNE